MAERFLHGYPINGRWHRPSMEVAGLFVDTKLVFKLKKTWKKDDQYPDYTGYLRIALLYIRSASLAEGGFGLLPLHAQMSHGTAPALATMMAS